MNRRLFRAGWVVVGLLAVGSWAYAQDEGAEARLEFRAFRSAQEMLDLTSGGVLVWPGMGRYQPGRITPPATARDAVIATASLEWMTRPLAVALGKSSASVKVHDRLWLDWNADGKFAEDEMAQPAGEPDAPGGPLAFGPIERKNADGTSRPAFCIVVTTGSLMHIVPAGLFEGEVSLGGRTVRVGTVDRGANRVYGDLAGLGEEGDLLLVDFDGDGRFAAGSSSRRRPWECEVLPITRVAQMPDGRYYKVTVSEDGNLVKLSPADEATARLKVGGEVSGALMYGSDGLLTARGSGGEIEVPAGRYPHLMVVVGQKDQDGRLWSFAVSPMEGRMLRLSAGQTLEVSSGPPFRLELAIGSEGAGHSFSLGLKDRAGHDVNDISTPDGENPKEPSLRITDGAGRAVHSGSFHYG